VAWKKKTEKDRERKEGNVEEEKDRRKGRNQASDLHIYLHIKAEIK
jgi:hypothetical protein